MALLGLFVAASAAAGLLAWWLVGPRRAGWLLLPVLAPFGTLYLAGHRLGWSIGPSVRLFGFDVALPFDLALAVMAAFVAAAAQRTVARAVRRGA